MKLSYVKPSGAGLTSNEPAPRVFGHCQTRVRRVLQNLKSFEFVGLVDGISCNFKVDSGSDVTFLNLRFMDQLNDRLPVNGDVLKYPTG